MKALRKRIYRQDDHIYHYSNQDPSESETRCYESLYGEQEMTLKEQQEL